MLRGYLKQYFPRRDDLESFLFEHLDWDLEDIVTPNDTLPKVIKKVVSSADGEGALCSLVIAARKARPRRNELTVWCKTKCPRDHCRGTADDPSLNLSSLTVERQVLEGPVFFDLDELRTKVRATFARQPSGAVCFGVAYEDDMFVNTLAKWFDISKCLPQAQIKDMINLDPLFTRPTSEQLVRTISLHLKELDHGDVLQPVRLGSATAGATQEFLAMVHSAYSYPGRNRLVLILTAGSEESFPGEIIVLPRPQFTNDQIMAWALELAQYVCKESDESAWVPSEIADDIIKTAWLDDSLDTRLVYTKMNAVTKEINHDPDAYLAMLKGRRR